MLKDDNKRRCCDMLVSYDKLWKFLIDRKMNCTDLTDTAGISFIIIAKWEKRVCFHG